MAGQHMVALYLTPGEIRALIALLDTLPVKPSLASVHKAKEDPLALVSLLGKLAAYEQSTNTQQ